MTQIKPLQVKNRISSAHLKTPYFSEQIEIKEVNHFGIDKLTVSDPHAMRAVVALMDMGAVIGGAACHYGGPAALGEIWSVAHAIMFKIAEEQKKPWTELFHFVNDAGHCENGLYALKANYEMAGIKWPDLKKFRSFGSPLTGHGEAHLFPEGVLISNGPLGSAFPQSEGLAAAEKLSGHHKTTICTISDGASMEGEAKEAFASVPGLASKGKLGPYILLISDNNTKLTGRIDAEAFSMNPTFESLETLGWNVIKVEKGNDLVACAEALVQALKKAQAHPEKPVAIWLKTIKGIGTVKSAQSSSGAHGFPCKTVAELKDFVKEVYQNKTLPDLFQNWISDLESLEKKSKENATPDTGEKIQKGISKSLIKAAQKGLPVISVSADLPGSTGVADFRKEFPNHTLDVGVAESNMISLASGLAKEGYIPVVDTFAQFGVTKGALPLTMGALSQAPVIAIFSHTGFQDAADGASHQALSYMSMLATIPNVDLYSLSCSEEAEAILDQVIEKYVVETQAGRHPNTSVLFLGRENFPKSFVTNAKYELAAPQVISQNIVGAKNVLLVTTGSLVGEAVKAATDLKEKSIGSIVVNLNCLNKLDVNKLIPLVDKCEGRLITIEDHQVLLGLGAFVSHQLVSQGQSLLIKSLGVHGEFGQSAYTAQELYHKHGMDSQTIVKAATELLN